MLIAFIILETCVCRSFNIVLRTACTNNFFMAVHTKYTEFPGIYLPMPKWLVMNQYQLGFASFQMIVDMSFSIDENSHADNLFPYLWGQYCLELLKCSHFEILISFMVISSQQHFPISMSFFPLSSTFSAQSALLSNCTTCIGLHGILILPKALGNNKE